MECKTWIYILSAIIILLIFAFWRHYVNMPNCSVKSEIIVGPAGNVADLQSISITGPGK